MQRSLREALYCVEIITVDEIETDFMKAACSVKQRTKNKEEKTSTDFMGSDRSDKLRNFF